MRILHILAQVPSQTGSGIYYQNLVKGLADKGVENALVFGLQSPDQLNEFSFVNTYPHFPVIFNSPQLPFPVAGMSDEMPYTSTIYSKMTPSMIEQWRLSFKETLEKATEIFRPDIIISHHLWFLTSLVLDIFPQIPIIAISHGTDLRQARMHPLLKSVYVKELNRLKLVFSLSEQDRLMVHEEFDIDLDKIHVTGNGYNSSLFYPPEKGRTSFPIKLLYAGKLSPSKGVKELVHIYPLLKSKYPHIQLQLIGNGPVDFIESLRKISESTGDLIIESAVPQPVLSQKMHQAHLFILPSFYEGLATIVIEALASHLRVVVSRFKPLEDYLGALINQSGILSYVDLPRIHDQDHPYEEDLPNFRARLFQAISEQIEAIQTTPYFTPEVSKAILTKSWSSIIEHQYQLLEQVKKN